VSQPHRWPLLQRAIFDFNAQTLLDRELVVVVNDPSYSNKIQGFVDTHLHGVEIRVLLRNIRTQLEGLQFAQMAAKGQILAIWDDDNLNRPDRLLVQCENLKATPQHITVLSRGLYYFHRDSELFVVDCAKPTGKIQDTVLPTSIMAYREFFPVLDHTARINTCEQLLATAVRQSQRVRALALDYLHVVTVIEHPASMRSYSRHRAIAEANAQALKVEDLQVLLDRFTWEDKQVHVQNRKTLLFSYQPKKVWPVTLDPVESNTDENTQSED
jgi:hypothetical protein